MPSLLCLLGGLACSGVLAAGEAPPRPLNLLFLMTDQHHAGTLGCAGHPVVKTPNLDRLAAGGTRFTSSFCAVPYCSPTRLALVTGRCPSSLGLGRNIQGETDNSDPLRLRDATETYLARLAARGYHCHQLGKWHLGDPAELACFPDAARDREAIARLTSQRNKAASDKRFDAEPRPGEKERVGQVWLPAATADAHRRLLEDKARPKQDVGVIGRSTLKPEFTFESLLADYCIELVKRHRDEPFAITYSVSPPHAPFIAPAPYYDLYEPARLMLPATWTDRPAQWATSFSARMASIYGEAGCREYLRCYFAQVTMMDGCLGRILAALDELKLTDRTLVIFTSDHGNMLGQHGMMEKGSGAFYDDLMRVPLLVRLPGRIPAGRTCDAPATSVDVAPTILDYLGAGPLAHGHGRSLRPFLDGAPADDRPVFGERGDVEKPSVSRMIRTRQWKLCLLPKGEKELYDLQKDPDEIHNRAAEPALAAVVARLTAQLVEHMRAVGDPAVERFTQ